MVGRKNNHLTSKIPNETNTKQCIVRKWLTDQIFNIQCETVKYLILFDRILFYLYLRRCLVFGIQFTNKNKKLKFVIRFVYEWWPNRQINTNTRIPFQILAQA